MNDNSRKTVSNPFYLNINHIFLIFPLLFLQPQSTASQTEKKEKKKDLSRRQNYYSSCHGGGKKRGKNRGEERKRRTSEKSEIYRGYE